MTPAAIIKEAMADGVSLALSPAGTIKATGEGAVVTRWLPVIRKHKPGIVTALQETGEVEPLPDPATEARRKCLLELLAANPGAKYAAVADNPDTDPVLVTVGIQNVATLELVCPKAKFDPFLLLDLLDRHGGTVH
jgi:hypothetical protein